MSHAAVYEAPGYEPPVSETDAQSAFDRSAFDEPAAADPSPSPVRRTRGGVLLASLAGAFVTTCLSGASIYYALTHIPEVDPNAEAAPVAAVAEIAADASATPTKLEVLTPPVYGSEIVSEAPAFVPLNAKVNVGADTVTAFTQADAVQVDGAPASAPVDDSQAQPGAIQPASMSVVDTSRPDTHADADNDGNAPPPPDVTVN